MNKAEKYTLILIIIISLLSMNVLEEKPPIDMGLQNHVVEAKI